MWEPSGAVELRFNPPSSSRSLTTFSPLTRCSKMKFLIIKAKEQKVEFVDLPNFDAALKATGLEKGRIDFGTLTPNIHIVVYEFGLLEPPADHSFVAIGRQVLAGNVLMFGSDDEGDTADIPLEKPPAISFFPNSKAVEKSIQLGLVDRPQSTVNGVVTWQWQG